MPAQGDNTWHETSLLSVSNIIPKEYIPPGVLKSLIPLMMSIGRIGLKPLNWLLYLVQPNGVKLSCHRDQILLVIQLPRINCCESSETSRPERPERDQNTLT